MVRRELVWGVVREPPSPFRKHQGVVTQATVLLAEHVQDQSLAASTSRRSTWCSIEKRRWCCNPM